MSTRTSTRKRKGADDVTTAVKKARVSEPKTAKTSVPSSKEKVKAKKTIDTSDDVVSIKKPKTVKNSTGKTSGIIKDIVKDNENDGPELTEDQTAALLAGFSSSDEDDDDEAPDALGTANIPNLPTTGDVQKRIRQAIAEQDNPETTAGVIYIGRVPHGFYEQEMRAYLSQFGDITRLRLARNKRTGRSRHFAFVEFASAAVADIVVKTMDKYLLFGHLLQVRRVPNDQVKDKMFVGAKAHVVPRNKLEGKFLNNGMVREDWERRIEREKQRRAANAEKLKDMGYEFDPPALKSVSAVPVKQNKLENSSLQENGEGDVVAVVEQPEVIDVVSVVQTTPTSVEVTEKVTTKKRSAEGKTKVKKVVKKAKA